ncbi:helix-turn-helix transcriptional regulator [Vibrio agarivorans]|uniref:helix-turn-helix transcriptional regulator n=1 Tax=Vibrio agarivorans TaxID=153622 RepID=UPI0025B5468D|nr:helix-turn-helix transcriptional regulator [Vibrio agarivorans]MDN3662219.1 helix-turn-helix transcriptional regulator [Vibrio agarivorans]
MSSHDSKRQDGQALNSSSESVHDTIARLRSNQARLKNTVSSVQSSSDQTSSTQTKGVQKRASKNAKAVSVLERQSRINKVIHALLIRDLTQGQALKELRMEVLGIKQDAFAKMVGVSRKTISEIENDRGAFKTDILDKVFKPFGLKVGLVPVSASLLNSALKEQ